MARILADENIDIEIVNSLRSMKHDAICARSLDQSASGDGTTDLEMLQRGVVHRRIVLTFNKKHYKALHHNRALVPRHNGIIACPDPSCMTCLEFAEAVDKAINQRLKINKHFYQQFILLNSKGEVVPLKAKRKRKSA